MMPLPASAVNPDTAQTLRKSSPNAVQTQLPAALSHSWIAPRNPAAVFRRHISINSDSTPELFRKIRVFSHGRRCVPHAWHRTPCQQRVTSAQESVNNESVNNESINNECPRT